MATGVVSSFLTTGKELYQGTVTVDETGEVLYVSDSSFTSTNFTINEAVTFTISTTEDANGNYVASNVAVAVPGTIQTISSSSSNPITANVGDIYTITGASTVVSGAITINGGKVIVDQNAQISPPTPVNVTADGIIVARGGGQVTGGVVINTGGSMKVVKNGQVTGTVGINQGGRMLVGNGDGPGTINGSISITGIRDITVNPNSTITM